MFEYKPIKEGMIKSPILGGGVFVPPSTELMFASVQNRSYNSESSGVGQDRYLFRWPHILGHDSWSLCISSLNWTLQNTGKVDTGNDYTYEGVSFEFKNGTVLPVTWSGVSTKVIADGDNDIVSDEITRIQAGTTFLRGDTVWIKGIISVTAGDSVPVGNLPTTWVSNSQSFRYTNATNTPSSVTSAGVFTFSGAGTPTNAGSAHSPMLLGRPMSSNVLVYLGVGDSLAYGPTAPTISDQGAYGDGWFFRSTHNDSFGDLHAGMQFATAGIGTGAFLNSAWHPWCEYANRGMVQLLTNNVGNQTVSTMQGGIQNDVWGAMTSNGIEKILQIGLLSRTTSTDDFISAGNQTPEEHWEVGGRAQQMNAWFPTRVGATIDGYCDCSSMFEPSDATIWLTNGTPDYLTYDGTHPTSFESGNSIGYPTWAVLIRAARILMN